MPNETPFSRMLWRAHIADPVAFFSGRADRTTIANWKAGRRSIPLWVKDALRRRWRELENDSAADIDQMKTGPGKKAGTRNIMAYMARR